MTPNNLCQSLIVYGSYMPGRPNHSVVAHLPGTWRKGIIAANMILPPDGIGPGEEDAVEAWTITFDDCQAQMFTPEWDAQARLLYDRWNALDEAMGPTWARNQRRWWPAGSDMVPGGSDMIVVNIYLPIEHFPYLANQNDVPSPDDEDNIFALWQQQKSGEKQFDESLFLGLIKDSLPEQIPELFGDLPGGETFVARLTQFFKDHQLSGKSVLSTDDGDFYLYCSPLDQNALPSSKLIELAKADVQQFAILLQQEARMKDVRRLAEMPYEFVEDGDELSDFDSSPEAVALDQAHELLLALQTCHEPWFYALSEACYGIAATYTLRDWLLQGWFDVAIDLTPSYELWKAGGRYKIVDGTCYVFETGRREV
ncbi:hypothetical protein ACYFX5_07250 [Bremerella sp. T1]|uniref:hypothetical protein n=1 Tax=Bremerella sp. TYQ1 TaxID=3119568 RepID=UPI001CCBC763|nr:hypothetical protein [Bremerella volcania]UBM38053.1 hypothetical protein LA756_09185 [Bremerella volcania]